MPVSLLIGALLAAAHPLPPGCPEQPEPAPLASAAFVIPASGDALLFSAAPSAMSVRYALRVVRPAGARTASALLVRLDRRLDCNVHDRAGEWSFTLARAETDALFAAEAGLERAANDPPEVVLDGTAIEVKRYAAGRPAFTYSSNTSAKERLSAIVLDLLRHHVPSAELPQSDNWRFKLPGTPL